MEATGNRYFGDILRHFGAQLIPRTRIASIHQPQRDPDYLRRVNREHEEILAAIAMARAMMSELPPGG